MLSISLSSCFTNDETLKPFSLIVFLTRIMKSSGASQVVLVVKNLPASAGDVRDTGSIPGSGKSPEGGHGNSLQLFLPGESHGQRSLVGYSPQGHKESDMTKVTAQHAKSSTCMKSSNQFL